MNTLTIISIFLSTSFTIFTHPMLMVIIISAQCLTICLMINTLILVSWFSYILFLVFMGGLMVLFIYISSLASNEEFIYPKMTDSFKKMFNMVGLTSISAILVINFMPNVKQIQLNIKEIIFKMYSPEMFSIILLTMLYLLLVLIIIVTIATLKEGPLRPFY